MKIMKKLLDFLTHKENKIQKQPFKGFLQKWPFNKTPLLKIWSKSSKNTFKGVHF